MGTRRSMQLFSLIFHDSQECINRNVYVMLIPFDIMMDAPHIREDISILQSVKQFDGLCGIW